MQDAEFSEAAGTGAADEPRAAIESGPEALAAEVISQDDRNWAMLAYLVQVCAPLIGPLAIYFCCRERSRFTAFHALQAALMILAYLGICSAALAAAHTLIIIPVAGQILARQLMLTPFIGLVALVIGSVLLSVKAHAGQYARVPVLAEFAEQHLTP